MIDNCRNVPITLTLPHAENWFRQSSIKVSRMIALRREIGKSSAACDTTLRL